MNTNTGLTFLSIGRALVYHQDFFGNSEGNDPCVGHNWVRRITASVDQFIGMYAIRSAGPDVSARHAQRVCTLRRHVIRHVP